MAGTGDLTSDITLAARGGELGGARLRQEDLRKGCWEHRG